MLQGPHPLHLYYFLETYSELHLNYKLPLNWVKSDKKLKIFNFSTCAPPRACDPFNASFLSRAIGAQEVLQGPHPLHFYYLLETNSELHLNFKLPLKWGKCDKK